MTLDDWIAELSYGTNSIYSSPPFISASDLHINNSIQTEIESGGASLGVLDDIDNESRFGDAAYTGAGSAPDIGADEGDFLSFENKPIAGFGYSLFFNGIDNVLTVPDNNTLNLRASDFTIETWVKLDNVDQTTIIYEKAENSGNMNQVSLWVNGANVNSSVKGKKIVFTIYGTINSTERACYTKRDIIDGEWHHIAAVADATNNKLKIFVDGIEEDIVFSEKGTWPDINNSIDSRIMCDNRLSAEFQFSKGFIDELRIWTEARDKKTIQKFMYTNIPMPLSQTTLAAYWKFDINAGTIAWDHSANNNDGAIVGAKWTDPGAPVRIVTKNNYKRDFMLPGYDFDGDAITFSIITNGTIGTVSITDAATGQVNYLRTGYGNDKFVYRVTANGLFHDYIINLIPTLNKKGVVDDFVSNIKWVADTVNILGTVIIGQGTADTTVVIMPNTYVQFKDGTINDYTNPDFDMGHLIVKGQLIADGKPDSLISFSIKPGATNNWGNIIFESTITPSSLKFCNIQYGSKILNYSAFPNAEGVVSALGSTVLIDTCTISNNASGRRSFSRCRFETALRCNP